LIYRTDHLWVVRSFSRLVLRVCLPHDHVLLAASCSCPLGWHMTAVVSSSVVAVEAVDYCVSSPFVPFHLSFVRAPAPLPKGMDSCNEDVANIGHYGSPPDRPPRELASSASSPLGSPSLDPHHYPPEVVTEPLVDAAPASLGALVCARDRRHAQRGSVASPPPPQEHLSSAAGPASREPAGPFTAGAPAGLSTAGPLSVPSTAGVPAASITARVTHVFGATGAPVGPSAAGSSGAGSSRTGATAAAGTKASTALPEATATASGGVSATCWNKELERYEIIMSSAEDFGEAW